MSKRLVASAIGKQTDEEGRETCYFDTYIFFSVSALPFLFQLRKRNNCFTRSFHAFSFESEFAGGRAFARGPLFFKKKEKTKKDYLSYSTRMFIDSVDVPLVFYCIIQTSPGVVVLAEIANILFGRID